MKKSASRSFLHPAAADALARFGARISLARRARRLTQADMAAKAGISVSTLLAIEAGAPTVQMGFYLAALVAVDALQGMDQVAVLAHDPAAVDQLGGQLLPRRVRK